MHSTYKDILAMMLAHNDEPDTVKELLGYISNESDRGQVQGIYERYMKTGKVIREDAGDTGSEHTAGTYVTHNWDMPIYGLNDEERAFLLEPIPEKYQMEWREEIGRETLYGDLMVIALTYPKDESKIRRIWSKLTTERAKSIFGEIFDMQTKKYNEEEFRKQPSSRTKKMKDKDGKMIRVPYTNDELLKEMMDNEKDHGIVRMINSDATSERTKSYLSRSFYMETGIWGPYMEKEYLRGVPPEEGNIPEEKFMRLWSSLEIPMQGSGKFANYRELLDRMYKDQGNRQRLARRRRARMIMIGYMTYSLERRKRIAASGSTDWTEESYRRGSHQKLRRRAYRLRQRLYQMIL